MEQLILTPEERRLLTQTEFDLAPERRLELAEFVLSELHQPKRRPARRIAGILGVAIAALTLTGGVAFAWIAGSAAPKDVYVAYCYPDQSLDRSGDGWTGSEIDAASSPEGARSAVTALSTCGQLWQMGVVHAPGTAPSTANDNPVPELVACVDRNGDTVVFPGDPATCSRLGLPSLR